MGCIKFENKMFKLVGASAWQLMEAKRAGFVFDNVTKQLQTCKIDKAIKLRAFADKSAESKFKKYSFTRFMRPERILYPDHITPKPYQLSSALHCLTRSPAYLADEAGLGKSFTSIMCLNTVPGRALIVCPPYLKYNWDDELKKYLIGYGVTKSVHIVENSSDNLVPMSSDVVVLPDSLLDKPRIKEFLQAGRFEWLIIDEAHRFGHADTKRTHAVTTWLTDLPNRMVFLSGTPMQNRAMELFSLIDATAPETFGRISRDEFGERFCAPKIVERFERVQGQTKKIKHVNYDGTSNHLELNQMLMKTLMIRHLKKDHLLDLPPKTRRMIFLDQPNIILKLEKELLRKHSMAELLKLDNDKAYHLGDVAKYRKEVGAVKLKNISYIVDQIESNEKPIIIFAHHIDVVEGLKTALKNYNPIVIRGGMTSKEKNIAVKEFMNGKSKRPLIGNISSMGVGLTLTRACKAIFFEHSWSSGENDQAEDRLHRISQTENVDIVYLILRNSLDERMLHSTITRQSDITKVMKPKTTKEETQMENVNSISVTIPNPTAAQIQALTSILAGTATATTATTTTTTTIAKGSLDKLVAGSTKKTKAPPKTVSTEEDEDFGEDALDEEDLELADNADDEEEDEDEPALDFATVKAACMEWRERNETSFKTILTAHNIKSIRELETKPKKWAPVYETISMKLTTARKK
jgi:SWI/SNF-related matrix-associated actin-dependent regulator 1 of chromatin subfamily A